MVFFLLCRGKGAKGPVLVSESRTFGSACAPYDLRVGKERLVTYAAFGGTPHNHRANLS